MWSTTAAGLVLSARVKGFRDAEIIVLWVRLNLLKSPSKNYCVKSAMTLADQRIRSSMCGSRCFFVGLMGYAGSEPYIDRNN